MPDLYPWDAAVLALAQQKALGPLSQADIDNRTDKFKEVQGLQVLPDGSLVGQGLADTARRDRKFWNLMRGSATRVPKNFGLYARDVKGWSASRMVGQIQKKQETLQGIVSIVELGLTACHWSGKTITPNVKNVMIERTKRLYESFIYAYALIWYLRCEVPGCMNIGLAPPKGVSRSLEKICDEYANNANSLRDVVRCTMVLSRPVSILGAVIGSITRDDINGMRLVKCELDKWKQITGYSDLNYVVQLPNGETLEVQGNSTFGLFGKGDYKAWKKFCMPNDQQSQHKYNDIKGKCGGIEGGMGHLIYEVIRKAPKGSPVMAEGNALGKRYYGLIGDANIGTANLSGVQALQADIDAFLTRNGINRHAHGAAPAAAAAAGGGGPDLSALTAAGEELEKVMRQQFDAASAVCKAFHIG